MGYCWLRPAVRVKQPFTTTRHKHRVETILFFRGVGFTKPPVNVFPDYSEGTGWRLKVAADPLYNITPDAVSRAYARYTTYNTLAEGRTNHIAPYVNTAMVARDMLEITQAHGFDKLQYWGFS